MKYLKSLLTRIRRTFSPAPGKQGSSLAFVMMIGAALVIWTLCILPLMTTTGNAAYKTQGSYNDYLLSRSSIEFAKSELEKIVETKFPYTFAVVKEGDTFRAVKKKDENGLTGGEGEIYKNYINAHSTDDKKDVPKADELGNAVTAICAVTRNMENPNIFDITIASFHNGKKGMTYTATFTPRGSLLIHPEAYKQHQALPLSDFVLVDGKLGSNVVWQSNITMDMANTMTSNGGDTSGAGLQEELKKWIPTTSTEWDGYYANTGEYPAVFKGTALASKDTSSWGGAITLDNLTSKVQWILPHHGNSGINGYVSYSSGTVKIKVDGSNIDITDKCTLYYNGNTDRTGRGYYTISIDYSGDTDKKILPVNGLVLTEINTHNTTPEKQPLNETSSIEKIERIVKETDQYGNPTKTALQVTLKIPKVNNKEVTDLFYGMVTGNEADEAIWQSSNVFELPDETKSYFFYICRPAGFDENNQFKLDSDLKSAGMIFPSRLLDNAAQKPTNGKNHIIFGIKNNTRYLLKKDRTADPMTSYITEGYIISTDSLSQHSWNYNQYDGSLKNTSDKYLYINKTDLGLRDGTNSYTKLTFGNGTVYRSSGSKYYLNVANGNGSWAAIKDDSYSTKIRYWIPPTAPDIDDVKKPSETFNINLGNVALGTNVVTHVSSKVNNVTEVYANTVKVTGSLNAGSYDIVVKINDGHDYYASLGKLTVNKGNLSGDLAVTVSPSDTDVFSVNVAASDRDTTNGGILYYGYRELGETDYHWYTSGDSSFTFRLDYGNYAFAVMESGNKNYSARQSAEYEYGISATNIEGVIDWNYADFVYTYNSQTDEVVWYKLPTEPIQLTPGQVHLVFGIPVGTDGIQWTTTYTPQVAFHGVAVDGSPYTVDNPLRISSPVGISNVNGHISSMIRGSSLYFMNSTNSINTFGNSISISTDLLVLNSDITGDGNVLVTPYSTGEEEPGDTLLFISNTGGFYCNGEKVFEGRTFYKVPANTDLCHINAEMVKDWWHSHVDKTSEKYNSELEVLLRQETYPTINLEIAYADQDQLACIISSETTGWTADGVLNYKRGDDEWMKSYAVCTYVTEVAVRADSTAHSLSANRILLAAKTWVEDDEGEEGSGSWVSALHVSNSIEIYTRYMCIDVASVQQTARGVKFTIENLGQETGFINLISEWINSVMIPTVSKTLQLEYEHPTYIYVTDSENNPTLLFSKSPQVYRYLDGSDLFSVDNTVDLMAVYKPSELEEYAGATGLKTIDRYTSIKNTSPESPEPDDGTVNFSGLAGTQVSLYTNYVYVDGSVTSFEFKESKIAAGFLNNSSGIYINSQESGFTTKEYLGFFQSYSAESYNGTIVYFAKPTTITVRSILISSWVDTYTMKGFYYIPAKNGGTSLIDVAKDIEANGEESVYYLDPGDLPLYSIYILPDGTLSNTYVDTGLFDNSSVGLGGFSGGGVE